MTPQLLDYYFPFIVFLYGFLILLVLEALPNLVRGTKLEEICCHPAFSRIEKRKPLAWICFFVGALWSVQNLWTSM